MSKKQKDKVPAPTTVKKAIKENPKNIRIRGGQRMALSVRFPGFTRMDSGALWFHNQEEMAKQSEYYMEVIQKSGKTMIDGKDIVKVSLPVQVHEPRSLIE